MEYLAVLYPLIDQLAPVFWVGLATLIGVRFGARAVMMVNLPVPIFIAQAVQHQLYGMEVVQRNALRTLLSLPMVYTWILCWMVVAPWVERRFPDPPGSHRSAWMSAGGSVAVAWLLNVIALRPLLAGVPQTPDASLPVIAVFALFGTAIPILAQRGEPPARADASLMNYLLRLLSIVFIVQLGSRLIETGSLPTVLSLLDSFPRLTFEMVIGVQAAHGFRAGRQVLVGLPVGLALPVGWCLLLILAPGVVGEQAVWGLVLGWSALALGGAVAVIRRLERPLPAQPD